MDDGETGHGALELALAESLSSRSAAKQAPSKQADACLSRVRLIRQVVESVLLYVPMIQPTSIPSSLRASAFRRIGGFGPPVRAPTRVPTSWLVGPSSL